MQSLRISICASIILLCALCSAHAQETVEAPFSPFGRKHPDLSIRYGEWGVETSLNATTIVKKLIRKSLDSVNLNPYLVHMRVSKGPIGLHVALGGDYDDRFDAVEGFADSKTTLLKALQLRAGPDYRVRLGGGLKATLGLDYVIDYRLMQQITDSGYDVVDQVDQTSLDGFGLNIGLSYWFSSRIGVMTETNFQLLSGYRDTGRRFKNFPELDDQLSYQDITTLRKSVLGGVFVVYRFGR
jgi:hypothetical protein